MPFFAIRLMYGPYLDSRLLYWVLRFGDSIRDKQSFTLRSRFLIYKPIVKHFHEDVIKWKHFPRYWPFVLGIHRSPVNSPRKGQWRGALMFSLICAWLNDWVNNREAGDLRRHRAHYDVIVMWTRKFLAKNRNLLKIKYLHILCSINSSLQRILHYW